VRGVSTGQERLDLSERTLADAELIEVYAQPFGRARLEALLGRGFLLSQAVERWKARAIWVISQADSKYPRRLEGRLKEDAFCPRITPSLC